MKKSTSILLAATTVLASFSANAAMPMGAAFQLNSIASTAQATAFDSIAVDRTNDGRSITAWSAALGSNAQRNVYLRRFTAAGVASESEFIANNPAASATSTKTSVKVAMGDNGSFAVIWEDKNPASPYQYKGLKARAFHADGTPAGAEFCVSTCTDSTTSTAPNIAADALGNFVVSWAQAGKVYARRFSPTGALREALPISVYNYNNTKVKIVNTAIAMPRASGDFVIGWNTILSSTALTAKLKSEKDEIATQAYRADGSKLGSKVNVEQCSGMYNAKQVSGCHIGTNFTMSTNDASMLALAWQRNSTSGANLVVRRYDAINGQAATSLVLTGTTGNVNMPLVSAMNSTGSLLMAWADKITATTAVNSLLTVTLRAGYSGVATQLMLSPQDQDVSTIAIRAAATGDAVAAYVQKNPANNNAGSAVAYGQRLSFLP